MVSRLRPLVAARSGFPWQGRKRWTHFFIAGLADAGVDDGAPGLREASTDPLYIAYRRDPDGNKVCATWKRSWTR